MTDTYKHDPFWKEIQAYLPEENRLTGSVQPEEYLLPVCGCELHIDHYKPASIRGRVILFHGVGGNGRLLSFIAIPLMNSGLEVICPDLPLYGYTRYKGTITYADWVACGTQLVRHYQDEAAMPTFLSGLSAGGMLAYQICCECRQIAGLIVTCLLDERIDTVRKKTARYPLLGMLANPFLSVAGVLAGNIRIPMKWVANMKAIVNSPQLAALLMKDRRSSGARVPLAFLYSMLRPVISIEPEVFSSCPVLLVHPGDDRWTDVSLSNLFFERLGCEKKTVILDGAGHFPIEYRGLKKLEASCLAFIEQRLQSDEQGCNHQHSRNHKQVG